MEVIGEVAWFSGWNLLDNLVTIRMKKQNLWMRDPRYKHKYLDKIKNSEKMHELTEMSYGAGDGDESDKHI